MQATEFIAVAGGDLWDGLPAKMGIDTRTRHGGEWHRKMMGVLTKYFIDQGYTVAPEPHLHEGRADLGVYKEGCADLFVEVGTTSVYKLWRNLAMATDCLILLVPDDQRAVEFTCRSAQSDLLRGGKPR